MQTEKQSQQNEELGNVVMNLTSLQKRLEEQPARKNEIKHPSTRTNINQTLYANDQAMEKAIARNTSTTIFSGKRLLTFAAVTAVVGFLAGVKIGLAIYYQNSPELTKFTVADVLTNLF